MPLVVLLAGELFLPDTDEDGPEAEWPLDVRKLWVGAIQGNFEPREDDLNEMELPCGAATYVLLAVSRRPRLCHFQ